MLSIRTILHPTDFSECSQYAFRLACALAEAHAGAIHLLHAAPHPVISPVAGIVPPEPDRYEEELTVRLNAIRAGSSTIPLTHQLIFSANPAGEIVRVAEAITADLIVMGTHGRTGLRGLLMGSVAAQVVSKAPCPVLTVKLPLAESRSHEKPSPQPAHSPEAPTR